MPLRMTAGHARQLHRRRRALLRQLLSHFQPPPRLAQKASSAARGQSRSPRTREVMTTRLTPPSRTARSARSVPSQAGTIGSSS
jgi:hypothetical protein